METEFSVGELEVGRESNLEGIIALIKDSATPVSELSRLIAIEMASVLNQMAGRENSVVPDANKHRILNDQLKGLGVLQKSLSDAEVQARKDSLNLDGPKFKFIFSCLVDFFKEALKESKVDSSTSVSVLRHFEDICRSREKQLRKELRKK